MSAGERGLLLTFEGLDGSGKSTQARRLARYLGRLGLRVVHTREPGGTPAGRRIRAVLLGAGPEELLPQTELLLMMADRAQHVARVVEPALASGTVVVCERFADSSVAYQAFGLGLERSLVEMLNRWATGGLTPDLTFLLDLPPGHRLGRRRARPDRIEGRGFDFFARVRQGYLALAAEEPGRFVVIDAAGGSRSHVHRQVVAALHQRLGRRLQELLGGAAGLWPLTADGGSA